jgi:hypothetical protein
MSDEGRELLQKEALKSIDFLVNVSKGGQGK